MPSILKDIIIKNPIKTPLINVNIPVILLCSPFPKKHRIKPNNQHATNTMRGNAIVPATAAFAAEAVAKSGLFAIVGSLAAIVAGAAASPAHMPAHTVAHNTAGIPNINPIAPVIIGVDDLVLFITIV